MIVPVRARVLAPVLLASAVWAALAQDQRPTFQASSSELVVLPVVVVDARRGGFVTTLTRADFTVFDNGRPQEIALFSSEDLPVTIGVVIDNSGSMGPKLPETRVAVLALARSSHPGDEIFTIPFSDRVIERAVHERVTAADTEALERELGAMAPQGRTALYDALVAALDRIERGADARKALVVISDGGDNASRATLDEVLARARRSNVAIYTIGLFDPADPDRNARVLKALAEATGAVRFLPRTPGELLRDCLRIARELRAGYTIGFVPPDHDGTYHRIRVEVSAPHGQRLIVRTRPGYFAAGPPVRTGAPR